MSRNQILPENERERLEALINHNLMEKMPEGELEVIARLAAQVCQAPVALLTIFDGTKHHVRASVGLNIYELRSEFDFSDEITSRREFVQIPDAYMHPEMRKDPQVMGHPNLRFFAGVPLITLEGYPIGTLFVVDYQPRSLSSEQAEALKNLGRQVIRLLELRKQNKNLQTELNQLLHERINQTEIDLAAYKFALDQSSGVAISDPNGYIKFVNDKFCKSSGYIKEELLGQPYSILNSGHHKREFFRGMWETISKGVLWHGEIRNKDKQGNHFWVDCSIIPFLDKKGKPYQYMSIQQDITEKKSAQERMTLETRLISILSNNDSIENSMQHILEQICYRLEWDLGVFLVPDNKELKLNVYYQLTYPHHDTLKKHLYESRSQKGESLTGMAWDRKKSFWTADMRQEKEESGQFLSSQFGLRSTFVFPVLFNNEVNGVMQFFSFRTKKPDINLIQMFEGTSLQIGAFIERKLAEAELLKAKKQAEESLISKDLFLTNMSHEIRTPMNAIIGFTDLLSKTALDERQKEYAESVKIAGGNLLSIINDILDFSKIESGVLNIDIIPADVHQIMKNVYDLLRLGAREKSLEFSYSYDNSLPPVLMCDPLRLNQILINLVGNAIKFTETGSVRFETRLMKSEGRKHQLLFSVKDTGIGIKNEKKEKIFERFTQVNNEINRKYEGTGLGLSISKNLIELMGGRLEMYSVEGRGSEFWFTLWLETGVMTETDNELMTPDAAQFTGRPELLVIEDNHLNQKLARNVLEQLNYQVDMASNGQIGLEMLRSRPYDLVLMDLQMPELDGYQTTRIIREEMGLKVPIIAMTAHSIVGEKEKCLQAGMNDFISKPFNPNDLNSKIIRLLTGSRNDGGIRRLKDPSGDGEVLSYLRELSNGNASFENEIIRLFMSQMPEELGMLSRAIGNGDVRTVRDICHKLKSSLDIFGRNDISEELGHISTGAVSGMDPESLLKILQSIQVKLDYFYPVLETHLDGLQKTLQQQ